MTPDEFKAQLTEAYKLGLKHATAEERLRVIVFLHYLDRHGQPVKHIADSIEHGDHLK